MFCGSVDDCAGAADAHAGRRQLFPGVAAADAVRRQAYGALERTHRVFRAAAEDAVQRAVGVAKRILFMIVTAT